jgi:hypothetical protein
MRYRYLRIVNVGERCKRSIRTIVNVDVHLQTWICSGIPLRLHLPQQFAGRSCPTIECLKYHTKQGESRQVVEGVKEINCTFTWLRREITCSDTHSAVALTVESHVNRSDVLEQMGRYVLAKLDRHRQASVTNETKQPGLLSMKRF